MSSPEAGPSQPRPTDRGASMTRADISDVVQSYSPDSDWDLGVRADSTVDRDPLRTPQRPWADPVSSRSSFEQVSDDSEQSDDGARLHSTPGRTGLGLGRPPDRPYDASGRARPGPLGMIARSPTVRQVSKTLRHASMRVVNVMGKQDEYAPMPENDYEGMARLPTRDEDSPFENATPPEPPPIPPRPPARAPVPGEMRGRTLCLFGPNSRARKVLGRLLLFPTTEPTILILIMTNVVVLTIQAAPPLFSPRETRGYFRGWEDTVLFALFILFTVEMFARIVVTGLILDPETSVPSFARRTWAFIVREARADDPAKVRTHKEAWHQRKPTPSRSSSKILSEAPFEEAVARQKGLLVEQRPYLRHSWHRIDMVAILSFWITFALAVTDAETTASRHLFIFRALSVLRATRLLVITSGTATILHSLKRAGPLILNVSWFIVFAAAMFSIVGVQSFRGSLRRACVLQNPNNATDAITLGTCGGYVDAETLLPRQYLNADGSESRIQPKGYLCPIGQIQDKSLSDDSQSFDNIFKSLVQVLIIAGVNTWTDTMYDTMDAEYFASALFFIVGIIVLNLWLANLLVAVVVNTFQDIRADTKRSAFGADHSLLTEPEWAQDSTKKSREPSKLLKWYRKTELFWVALVLVDIIAQATKTADSSPGHLAFLRHMSLAFAFVWDVEILLRFIAFLPDWPAFLRSGRNDCDLLLALLGSIIQIPPIRNSSVYPWLTVFTLFRWYRVILVVPRMKPLLINVFGSFTGLLNMVFFLFLMNFLAALMAVQLLRGDMGGDDQMIDFSQAWNAFLGMYQVFSTENWTTVLYDSMSAEWAFSQGWIVCIFLFLWFFLANFIIMQMFIAVINENFSVAEEEKRKQQIESFIRKAEPVSAHVSWIERLNPYRLVKGRHVAVKVDKVPQNLLLPLKQTIGADVGDPDLDRDEHNSKGAMKRLFGMQEDGTIIPVKRLKMKRLLQRGKAKGHSHSHSHDDKEHPDDDEDRGLTDLLPPLHAGPSVDEHKDALRERRNQQADFISAHPSYDRSLWILSQDNKLRQLCQSLVPPAYGRRIFGRTAHPIWSYVCRAVVFLAVVASIVVAAVASPQYRKEYYTRNGYIRRSWFDITEAALAGIFLLEAAIKVVADGFIFAPNAYLLSVWNVVDFLILLALLTNTASSLIVVGGVNRLTRAFKAFRVLRLITLFSRLRDTFHIVFFAGFIRILDASILMILYLIPFAVWGLNIFARRLASCNDGEQSGRADCTGEYLASPVGELTFLAPRVWANPAFGGSIWSFDTFRQSVLILFEIVSLEGWTDVMASAMNIVGLDQQPQTNASQWNSIFFVIFNLFGGVIILTVFLSIIIENFSVRSGTALLTNEQKQWDDLSKFIRQQTPSQLPKNRPKSPLFLWCYRRATDKRGYWARAYTCLYFVHIIMLMTEDYSNSIMTETQLDLLFLAFTILYAIDLVVRFIGLRWKSFVGNGWNWFDVIVVTGSFATTIPALQASASGIPGNEVSKQVQKLFLVAVALKLVQRLDSLNQLFKTSVASLPAIGNLFLLWAVLFVFAAIVYTEVFGMTKMGNNAGTRFQNYHSFGNALVMLAFMSTGEGWNGYMHDYTVEFPRCTPSSRFLDSDCGSVGWAYVLFIAWNILSMYIFLNMFTGVVVQSFAYVYQKPGGTSLNREQIRSFKQAWAAVDVNRTGYIKRRDFPRFFSLLSGVFEVRPYPAEYSLANLRKHALPDPHTNKGRIIMGTRHVVDLRKIDAQTAQIDYEAVHARRRRYARLFYEAKMTAEPKGISFTNMLLLLAHYTLIDDERALQVNELLVRRARVERVDDLVNLDIVRGLIRTVYWRKRFLALRAQRRAQEETGFEDVGIEVPRIVEPGDSPDKRVPSPSLSPTPSYRTLSEAYQLHPLPPGAAPPHSPAGSLALSALTPSPPGSPLSPHFSRSPRSSAPPSPTGSGSPHDADGSWSSSTHETVTPSNLSHGQRSYMSHMSTLSAGSYGTAVRRGSRDSRNSEVEEDEDDILDAMAVSGWGDMMRAAMDEEDRRD